MAENLTVQVMVPVNGDTFKLLHALMTEDDRSDPAAEVAWLIEKERTQRERRRRINELLDGED